MVDDCMRMLRDHPETEGLYEREPFSSDPDWTMIDQLDESLPPGPLSTV